MEDYESDPDDTIVPMKRREASDDEDQEERLERRDRREDTESDEELDGQGGADAYEDECEEDEEEYDEYEEEEMGEEVVDEEMVVLKDSGKEADEDLEGSKKEGDEKKENEPFSVPTAGAFYMHDDRFRDNGRGRGRGRRLTGGGRIWESKDEHAWVHDRFEEMSLHGTRGRQNTRGRFRGRGNKNHSAGRGYVKDNRLRNQYDDGNGQFHDDNRYTGANNQFRDGSNQFRDGNSQFRDGNNHNRTEKTVRGRGSRRYVQRRRNEPSPSQYKQATKLQELTSHSNIERQSSNTSNVQPDISSYAKRNVLSSSLNSASPPFYPSGKQDILTSQKKDTQFGNANKLDSPFVASQPGSTLRGKAAVDSVSHNKGYIDDSLRSVSGNIQSRYQGRNMNINSQTNYQPTLSAGQMQPENQSKPASRSSTQQVILEHSVSPPNVPSANIAEMVDIDSPTGANKSKKNNQLIAQGKGTSQGDGRGPFLYNGAQVIGPSGPIGLSHNDQNFSPALLPVMQFGAQQHGGLGVPAVGMAFPGYVAQPQLGFQNAEMTWVPLLAGAAGALGSSYQYIPLDESGYPRPLGQTSASVTSRETTVINSANAIKPSQLSETVNDEYEQRQNKPRRYSKMNFGQ